MCKYKYVFSNKVLLTTIMNYLSWYNDEKKSVNLNIATLNAWTNRHKRVKVFITFISCCITAIVLTYCWEWKKSDLAELGLFVLLDLDDKEALNIVGCFLSKVNFGIKKRKQ